MTAQPVWKMIANLGDASPLDHGGYFVYEDTTGVYGFEAERVEPNEDDTIEVRRICLDRCKVVDGYLVPYAYEASWSHPVKSYDEWFARDLASVADFVDSSEDELRRMLCSADGIERAEAYRNIYDYHGWDNGDEYPLTLTREEAEERYK